MTATAGDFAAAIARTRSLDAELATEQAADDGGVSAHQLAAQLHAEAAKWTRQAGNDRRALRHEISAKVHARLVARLQQPDDGEESS